VEFQILRRLLTALTIDETKAEAIRDWIDSDIDVVGSNGAEDDFYTGQNPAYRAANGPMVSPSELLLIKGFRVTDEDGLDDYDQLLPHVTTLPTGAPINVNTASSPVLAALASHMPAIADELKVVDDEYAAEEEEQLDPEDEDAGGLIYEDITAFQRDAENQADPENENVNSLVESGSIDTKSTYYMSRVTVTRDEISITQYSIFLRESNGGIRILRRSRGSL